MKSVLPLDVLRTVLDALPMSVFVKDADDHFRFLLANRKMRELAKDDLEGKTDENLFDPALVAQVHARDRKTLQENKLTEHTVEIKGRLQHILTQPYRPGNGENLIIGTVLDVTNNEIAHRKMQSTQLLFEKLLQNLPLGVAVKDADNGYRIIRCNGVFERIAGHPAEKIIGHTVGEIGFTNLDDATISAQDSEVMATGRTIEYKETSPVESGLNQTFNVTKFPLRLEDGRNLLIGTFSDITDIQNLYESEQIVNAVLTQVMAEHDLKKITENVLGILNTKIGCEAIALFSHHEAENRYLLETESFANGHTSNPSARIEMQQKFLVANHPALCKGEPILIPDCGTAPFAELWKEMGMKSVCGSPIFLDDSYWGALFFGYTGHKRVFAKIDQRLIAALAKLLSIYLKNMRQEQILHQALRMEALATLSSGLAPEFNNLLQVILGNAEFALEDLPKGSPLKTDLQEIWNAAEEAKGVMSGLQQLAQRQSGAPRIQYLNLIVQGLLPICKRLAGNAIKVCFHASNRPCPVFMDHSQISQLLTALVSNARDAIAATNRKGEITIAVSRTEGTGKDGTQRFFARLTVTDNGCGMTDEIKKNIFTPFFTTKKELNKTGLGLSVVRNIVTQQSGTISVESVPGESTTFTILLPICDDP